MLEQGMSILSAPAIVWVPFWPCSVPATVSQLRHPFCSPYKGSWESQLLSVGLKGLDWRAMIYRCESSYIYINQSVLQDSVCLKLILDKLKAEGLSRDFQLTTLDPQYKSIDFLWSFIFISLLYKLPITQFEVPVCPSNYPSHNRTVPPSYPRGCLTRMHIINNDRPS
jgi:hypothetical protein